MTYNSKKINALLILIVCMSILASISCICAADTSDAIVNNQSSIDINALDDQESVEPAQVDIDANIDDSADVSDSADLPTDFRIIHHAPKYVHHHKNPKNSSNIKKINHKHKSSHKRTDNNTYFEKIQIDGDIVVLDYCLQKNGVAERESLPDSISIREHTQDGNCKATITQNIESVCIATNNFNRQISLNFTDSIKNTITHESEMTKDETCCCKHCQCNHNSNKHPHSDHKIIDGNVKNDFTYSYNHFTQINNNRMIVVWIGDSNKEENADPRNRNIKSIHNLNCSRMIIDDKNNLRDCGDMSNAMNFDFAINYTDSMHSGLSYGLKIALNSDELNIKDYNMEYYIFTNPYLIVKNIGVENIPLNSNVENHCLTSSKAKTIAPTLNYNYSLFNDCITHKPHDPSDFNSHNAIFSVEVIGFKYVNGECTINIYNFGGIKDV